MLYVMSHYVVSSDTAVQVVLSVSFFVSCTKRTMLITLASRFFESMDKEVLPMSDFELLMIVFTVLSLLIMAYNGRK